MLFFVGKKTNQHCIEFLRLAAFSDTKSFELVLFVWQVSRESWRFTSDFLNDGGEELGSFVFGN